MEILFRKIKMIIAAIDTETTGLDIHKHEIIQLAYIRFEVTEDGNFSILDKQEFKIKPSNILAASSEALKINGYNSIDWEKSICFVPVIKVLENIFNSVDCLLGQNLQFDLKFISKQYWKYGLKKPKYPKYIDTKYLGQQLINEGLLKSSSMDGMCKHFQIKFNGRAHTALADCERTIKVWEHLNKYTENKYFTFEEQHNVTKKIDNAG